MRIPARYLRRYSVPLISVAFISAGLLPQFTQSGIAAGTPAGTSILNRATATYEDPNNPGVPINATSNQVTVIVAEVAGLTNTPAGVTDRNGGSVAPGDLIDFDFQITNVGNAETNVFIPGTPVVQNLTVQRVVADLDGDGTFETVIPSTGFTTTTPLPADRNIRVRVEGAVPATVNPGDTVRAQLGDTGPNDNSAATQNQPSTGLPTDVRTVNTGPTTPPTEREASASQSVTVGQASNNRALATVLKTRSAYDPRTAVTTDDLITYRLDMAVRNSPPPGTNIIPGTLTGTTINLNGATATRVLVSDAIPVGTVLNQVSTTLPTGWVAVYSVTPAAIGTTDTAIAVAGATSAAQWTTTAPADLTTVRRIGFIFNGTLAPGYTTTGDANGFQFRVLTSNLPAAGGTVNNLAQLFGQTLGDATNAIIYDESGDQNPNNFNDDGTPGTPFSSTDNGVANPTTQSTDGNNNNTGAGPGGEVNSLPITPGSTGLLNGPQGLPAATGPTNNNDDFTNRSSNVPPNLPQQSTTRSTFNPDPIVFTNTFQNSTGTPLDNIRIFPLNPNNNQVPAGSRQPDTDVPVGTVVTIDPDGSGPLPPYRLTYNGTSYDPFPGETPYTFPTIQPGESRTYTVTVDLPNGTGLSADRYLDNGNSPARAGFPFPIVAFVEDGTPGFNGETTSNLTINRGYTGYISLVKSVQVLDSAGTVVNRDPRPGETLVYNVAYTNISTPAAGSGSVILNAANLTIDEDGNAAPNNWATFTTHVVNSATIPPNPTSGISTTYFVNATSSTTDPGTAVTRYQRRVNTLLAPGESGTFSFRRLIK